MKCPKCQYENPESTKFCGECGTQLTSQPEAHPLVTETLETIQEELATGSVFANRYQVIEELGKGGMGRVYKVQDTKTREKVALKLIKPEIAFDKETIERFGNELRLARRIRQKNVCGMYDLGEAGGAHFITMEYVHGEDLKSMIRMSSGLTVGTVLSIGKQICDGLAEAHSLGIVHRDLKPQNIMIDRGGNAKIMDFGIARSVREKGITGPSVIIGTPEYMSPEQAEAKDVDQRSDIYSLGVILYEMAANQVPFTGETALSIAMKHKGEIPKDPKQLNPHIPDDLGGVILKCLEKDKAKRYQSAAEVHAELERIEKGIPTTERFVPERKTISSRQITVRLPSKKIWIPASAVLTALVALLVWQFIPEKEGAKRAIAVIGFKNQTGDAGLNYLREAIPHLLITSLEQSKRLKVTSWERMKDLLRNSGRDAAAIYDEEAGFEACRKEGIEAIVLGSFVKAGETFATDVQVLDVSNKHILKSAAAKGSGIDSILKSQIDEISRTIRRGIALPALKIDLPTKKIIDLTTNSMEAYNLYLKAQEAYDNFFWAESKKYAEQSVGIDPTFALGYYVLSRAAGSLLDYPERDQALEKAMAFSTKATEKERLFIEAQYALSIGHDDPKRLRTLKKLVAEYPEDKDAHYMLGLASPSSEEAVIEYEKAVEIDPQYAPPYNQLGYGYARMGNYEKATRFFERYAELRPGLPNPIDSIAEMNMFMGNLGEAVKKYLEALAIKSDFYGSCAGLAYVYGLKEDYAETERWLEEFVKRAPTAQAKMEGAYLRVFCDYLLGRCDVAIASLLPLRSLAEQFKFDYGVAASDFMLGYLYSEIKEFDKARQAFESWAEYQEKSSSDPDYAAVSRGLLLGSVDLSEGKLEASKGRLAEVEKVLLRLDPGGRANSSEGYLLLAAEVALAGDSIEEAIAIGQKMDFGVLISVNTSNMIPYNIPFLKDVLARAYWKNGELDKAISEYERLTTIDPKSRLRRLISPLYHYRFGRVLEETGKKDRARLEYEKFLKYWAAADPVFPELQDARERLAGLMVQ